MIASLKIVRVAAQIIAGVGVSKVVSDMVKNNTTVTTQFEQLRVLVGGTVLSSMAVDLTHRHVDTKIDSVVAWYNEKKKAPEESPEEDVEK